MGGKMVEEINQRAAGCTTTIRQADPSHLHSISLQILFRTRPDSPVKDTAPDRRVGRLEGIQHRLRAYVSRTTVLTTADTP